MNRQPRYPNDAHSSYKPVAYQKLVVDGTVRTPSLPSPQCRGARSFFSGSPVRVQLDGTDPVGGSDGVPFYDGKETEWTRNELAAMKLIRDGVTNADVYFFYYN